MTEHVFTRRCNAQEGQCATFRHTVHNPYGGRTEPALGTLEERLGIIVHRQGGRTGLVHATSRERRDYAEWCQEQGIPNSLEDQ